MGKVEIRLADRSDDADLRRFIGAADMEGRIRMSVPREPSYFDALEVEGREWEVAIAREADSGRLVGMGVGAAKPAYLNGVAQRLGYLSGLRVAPAYRNGLLLVRLYRMAKERVERHRVPLFLTTIVEDNTRAIEILTSGKCGLPVYEDFGRLVTMVVSLRQRNPFGRSPGLSARRATAADLGDVVSFLNREGPKRQFFPVYEERDLTSPGGILRGLSIDDVFLAFEEGALVGTAAAWDQRGFRQNRITGYAPSLGRLRVLYNVYARAAGCPTLPRPGSTLDHVFVALVAIEDDRAPILATLMAEIFDAMKPRGPSLLTIGFHERDPLSEAMRRARHLDYTTRVFVAHWEGAKDDFERLDDRVPYLELGAL
jgi:hypothetical protein